MTRYGKRYSLCDLSIQIGGEETTENVGKNLFRPKVYTLNESSLEIIM